MKKIIGVMGPSEAKPRELKLARSIGKIVSKNNAVLLTGGLGGVMEEASRGVAEQDGLVVAICPTHEKADLNAYVDIPVMTGMRSGRNYMNVLSSDVVVAIGATSAGTLSEIAFAIQQQKPLILIGYTEAMKKYLTQFKSKQVYFAKTLGDVEKLVAKVL